MQSSCSVSWQPEGAAGLLETDSMLLQKGVQTAEMDHALAGIIFQDIRSLIWENFFHFELHVPRVCNSSAHEIAGLGMS
jgi:hypothetical protein